MRVISILSACISANNNFAFHAAMFTVCWFILPRNYIPLHDNEKNCFAAYSESIKKLKWMHFILIFTAMMNFIVDLKTSPIVK